MHSAGQRRDHSVRCRARLDQRLDLEPAGAEQRDPLSVRKLEGDGLRAFETVHAEVIHLEAIPGLVGIQLPAQIEDRARVAEREQPAAAQHPRRLGHGAAGVRERDRAVVAEHDVEAPVGDRHLLGAGLDQGQRDAGLAHQRARVLELAAREVEPGGTRAGLRQRDRPLRRPAAELEDRLAGDLAQHVQLALGDLPYAPGHAAAVGEHAPVALLVGVALRLPEGPVAGQVRIGHVRGSVGHAARRRVSAARSDAS